MLINGLYVLSGSHLLNLPYELASFLRLEMQYPDPNTQPNRHVHVCVRVGACVCVCVGVWVRECMCVCECVSVGVCPSVRGAASLACLHAGGELEVRDTQVVFATVQQDVGLPGRDTHIRKHDIAQRSLAQTWSCAVALQPMVCSRCLGH